MRSTGPKGRLGGMQEAVTEQNRVDPHAERTGFTNLLTKHTRNNRIFEGMRHMLERRLVAEDQPRMGNCHDFTSGSPYYWDHNNSDSKAIMHKRESLSNLLILSQSNGKLLLPEGSMGVDPLL